MSDLRASSSDVMLQPSSSSNTRNVFPAAPPSASAAGRHVAFALERPVPLAHLAGNSSSSETDYDPEDIVQMSAGHRPPSRDGAQGQQQQQQQQPSAGPSTSSRTNNAVAGPGPGSSSSRIDGCAAPSLLRRRSSSSSIVFLDESQPAAGPSRPRASPPPPPPRHHRRQPSSSESEIEFEGETGPRHRRTGRGLAALAAQMRRGEHRSPPPSLLQRSPTPPILPQQHRPGANRLGGAILRQNGVNQHVRPSAAARPPPRVPQPWPGHDIIAAIGNGFGNIADLIAGGVGRMGGEGGQGFAVHINGNNVFFGGDDDEYVPPLPQAVHALQNTAHGGVHRPVTAETLEDEWRRAAAYAPPPPLRTTPGFTRNFEREFGGYLSDSDDDNEQAVNSLFDEQPVAGPSKPAPSPHPIPVVVDLTDESENDDDIAIIEPDGQTSVVSHTPITSPSPPDVAPVAAAAPAVVNSKKRKAEDEAPPNLTLVCAGCNRPLILQAQSPGRKMHVLACGHLIDGYCLSFLSRPPGEPERNLAASTSSAAFAAAGSALRTRAKGKGRAPPAPRKKTFRWHCPVETCEREHTSDGLPVEDELGPAGDTLFDWKPKVGKGGVIPLYA